MIEICENLDKTTLVTCLDVSTIFRSLFQELF